MGGDDVRRPRDHRPPLPARDRAVRDERRQEAPLGQRPAREASGHDALERVAVGEQHAARLPHAELRAQQVEEAEALLYAHARGVDRARVDEHVEPGGQPVGEVEGAGCERCSRCQWLRWVLNRVLPRETEPEADRECDGDAGHDDDEAPHRHSPRRFASRASAQSENCLSTAAGDESPITIGSSPRLRKSPSSRSIRASFASRRARDSLRLSRSSLTRPPASANGTTSPSAGGKLCSQIGSWTITGTRSQRKPSARSHTSGGGGERKSEQTKTNVPAGSERRLCANRSNAASTPSAPPSHPASACRLATASNRNADRGANQPSPSAVSRYPARPSSRVA